MREEGGCWSRRDRQDIRDAVQDEEAVGKESGDDDDDEELSSA